MGRPRQAQLLEAFARAPVLSAMAPEERAELAKTARVVELRAGDLLWREGARAEAMTVSNPSITWPCHTTMVTGVPA